MAVTTHTNTSDPGFSEWTALYLQELGYAYSPIANTVGAGVSSVGNLAIGGANAIANLAGAAGNAAKDFAKGSWEATKALILAIWTGAGSLWDKITGIAKTLFAFSAIFTLAILGIIAFIIYKLVQGLPTIIKTIAPLLPFLALL